MRHVLFILLIMAANYTLATDYINPVYAPHGAAEKLFYTQSPEVIISGPAETGKTLACCWKAHLLACKYPGCNGAIVGKEYSAMHGTVLRTFRDVIKGAPVVPFGGERPEKFIYQNGSVIWVGGMDNPDKILSSERDFICANQMERFTLDDHEKMTTRTTGRNSVIKYPQLFGDCNPGGSKHWILDRAQSGSLELLNSEHKDNPTLYTADGVLTAQGVRTMNSLNNLTGVRHKRLCLGLWATAEGAVYDEFDGTPDGPHVKTRDAADVVRWYLAIDEGFTNPAVILLVGEDSDGRWHIFKEFYETGKLQSEITAQAKDWTTGYNCHLVAVDNSAAGLIADMVVDHIPAVGAKGRVLDGINHIQNRLKVAGDGLPRLTVDPSCTNTINEFESYIWKPGKDEPVKKLDHSMDAIRYLDNALANDFGVQIFV